MSFDDFTGHRLFFLCGTNLLYCGNNYTHSQPKNKIKIFYLSGLYHWCHMFRFFLTAFLNLTLHLLSLQPLTLILGEERPGETSPVNNLWCWHSHTNTASCCSCRAKKERSGKQPKKNEGSAEDGINSLMTVIIKISLFDPPPLGKDGVCVTTLTSKLDRNDPNI